MDFHSAMETFAEAWVAAHTHQALESPEEDAQALPTTLNDIPDMLSKGHVIDGRKSAGTPATSSGGVGAPVHSKKTNPKATQMAHLHAAHLEMTGSMTPGFTPESPGSQRGSLRGRPVAKTARTGRASTERPPRGPPPPPAGPVPPAARSPSSENVGMTLGQKAPQAGVPSLACSPDAKSMPIHCIVEQASTCGSGGGKATEVDMDTYAILPSSTLFNEIIRVAMTKLGYSVVEAMGAKGAIQIKNWKPLTFDTITDYPDATVEEVLGDLTSIATLRIRLCSRSKLNALEDVKEKLLQFLVQHSQGMLQSVGCPIEKGTLSRICKGDYPLNLPDDTRQAFERWYKDQTMKREPLSEHAQVPLPHPAASSAMVVGSGSVTARGKVKDVHYCDTSHHHVTGSYPTIRGELNLSMSGNGGTTTGSGCYGTKTRIRTSFDPEHEIPRLHRWFGANQHPSRDQMVLYLAELNALESRRGRKPLDLTNIIYWFKNARAAQRRATRTNDMLGEEPAMDVEQDSLDDGADRLSPVSSTESVPVLPNKNAVYVVSSPLHHASLTPHASSRSNSPVLHIIPQDPADDDDDRDPNTHDQPAGSNSRDTGGDPGETSSPGEQATSNGLHTSGHRHSTSVLHRNSHRKPSVTTHMEGVTENGHSHSDDTDLDEHMEEGQDDEGRDEDVEGGRSSVPCIRSSSLDSQGSHTGMAEGEKREDASTSGSGPEGEGALTRDHHHHLEIKQEMENHRDADYPSSSAATTPSPPQGSPPSTTSSTTPVGVSLSSSPHPPGGLHQGTFTSRPQPMSPSSAHMLSMSTPQPPPAHQSHPMAMAAAALPHPINFHYMHSAAAAAHALYGGLDTSGSLLAAAGHSPFKDGGAGSSLSADERKKRSRVFIDPLTEIPKLEKWFAEDTHPSSYMIEKYTEELNRSEYRQRFPKLEPKNVQLWFKNHRAKVKRGRLEQSPSLSMTSV